MRFQPLCVERSATVRRTLSRSAFLAVGAPRFTMRFREVHSRRFVGGGCGSCRHAVTAPCLECILRPSTLGVHAGSGFAILAGVAGLGSWCLQGGAGKSGLSARNSDVGDGAGCDFIRAAHAVKGFEVKNKSRTEAGTSRNECPPRLAASGRERHAPSGRIAPVCRLRTIYDGTSRALQCSEIG